LVVLGALGLALSLVLSNKIRYLQTHTLVEEAMELTSRRVLNILNPEDLNTPMTGERYHWFDRLVDDFVVSADTARVKVWNAEGTVIYSNDYSGVGAQFTDNHHLQEALRGTVNAEVKMPEDAENPADAQLGPLLEVYVPIMFPGISQAQGALEIYQYYGPTADQINTIQKWVKASVAVAFAVLYLSLVSIVWRGWRITVAQKARLNLLNTEMQGHLQGLDRRNKAVESANRELEAFCYSVSHDLRTPLRSIDGFSQALLEDYAEKLDNQGKGYLTRVRAATQRMGQLIDDLLGLSRMSRVKMELHDVDLSGLARSVAAELQQRFPQRQVALTIAPDVAAKGDGKLLRIALENLLGNAWKFTAKQPQAKIEFGVTESEGKNAYFIRDNGAGFDMAYADKLFGAFQRLHKADEFEGTGIGLATVQRVIHRHGGRIWAEGTPGKGATFYFTLESHGEEASHG
jgi:signal transduction histidine kinase